MVNELQADFNRLDRLFSKFSSEHKAVTISSVSLIIATLSLLMAWMAASDAKEANIRSQMQTEHIQDLKGDIDVYRIRAAKLDAWLKAHDVPTEEIYE